MLLIRIVKDLTQEIGLFQIHLVNEPGKMIINFIEPYL